MGSRTRQQGAKRGVAAAVRKLFRWLFSILLVSAMVAAAVLYFIHMRLDEEIRAHIENKFQANYPGLRVSVRSARRIAGRGIEVRGLSIAEPGEERDEKPLVYLDELLVCCNTAVTELVAGRADATQIVARRLTLRLARRPDGSWTTDQLLPLPQFGQQPPPARIEAATVRIEEQRSRRHWVLQDINVDVLPPRSNWLRRDAPRKAPQTFRIAGTAASGHFEQAELEAEFDPGTGQWTVVSSIAGLQASPELAAAFCEDAPDRADLLESLRGRMQLELRATNQTSTPLPFEFAVAGTFRGRIENPRLPRALTDVTATFRGNHRSLVVQQIRAQAGPTRISGSGSIAGWPRLDSCHLQLRAEHFVLDKSLETLLPGTWGKLWDRFKPRGVVDAELGLRFDGEDWTHDLTATCHGVSFAYHRFPYPLTEARGRIQLEKGVVTLERIEALASGRKVQIDGEIHDPGPDFTGWVELSVEQPVPIDERLLAALPGKEDQSGCRSAIRSLNPRGQITAWGRYQREDPRQELQKRLEIGLEQCAVNYDRFGYPIDRIRGTLSMTDDRWTFRGLEGYNSGGLILCEGGWQPLEAGGSKLWLDFKAMDVPLQDELRDALNVETQRIWKSLRPRGSIDQLNIALRFQNPGQKLSLEVAAHQEPAARDVEGRSITIKPSWLPYKLDEVVGTARFRDGVVELENIRARHAESKIRVDGDFQFGGGEWRIDLSRLSADRLHANHELTSALPPALGRAIDKLQLSGPVSLSGTINMTGRSPEPTPTSASWQLTLDVENGSIDCGVQLEHIHGGVTLNGHYAPQRFVSHGAVEIDSMIYKGIQLTKIRGPLSIDRTRVAFGQWASSTPPDPPFPRPLYADTLGGTLSGSAQIWLAESRYKLEGTLLDADLATISREATARQHNISGRAYATVRLRGETRGIHTLRGDGQVELGEADIYELPIMLRLLKLLSIKPADGTAFTSSNVLFRVKGDQIYLDHIVFAGDAISLEGRGEMNLERAINLTFDTSVGQDDGQPLSLLLRPFLKEAGRRLMVLRVTGTLDDPQVARIPLPDVSETIQQVFPSGPDGPRPAVPRLSRPMRRLE